MDRNKIELAGRLTRDPEVRYSNDNKAIARFSLAVNRKFKRDGEPEADFFNCVAFGKTAEVIEKYCHKGNSLFVDGRVQLGKYTNKDGVNVNTFDVMVDSIEFMGKASDSTSSSKSTGKQDNEYVPVPDDMEDLPFN